MNKKTLGTLVLLFAVIASITYYGCKKSDNQPATYTSTPAIKVKLATSSTLGQYLVDQNGVALYFFSNDYKGMNSCSGGCEAYWPYFYGGKLTQDSLGSGLNLADFDTIHVGNVIQTRYKGWPLYYYSPSGNGTPEAAGQTAGDGSQGVWFVAKPDYTIMLANGQMVGLDGKTYTSNYMEGTGSTIYFTDAMGLTLYTFSVDSFDINKFTKADFSNNASWPVYEITTVVVPSILNKTKFGNIMVAGHHQLTYNGWPLYHFGQDAGIRGSTKGVSVPVPGKWPVAVQNMNMPPQKQKSGY